jgi:hypothetical protein
VKIPGDIPQSGTGVDLVEDVEMAEFFLGIVIDGKGLSGEGLVA